MTEPIGLRGGNLTEEEVAAVLAVVAAASQSEKLRSADDRPLAGGWKSYYRTVRRQLTPGREAWRTSNRI